MSKITLKLTQQLKQASNRKLIKDTTLERWFTGGELAADVDQLTDHLRGLKVGHGDVVLVCLPNTAVYPVLAQAIWEVGAVMHPVAATLPAVKLQSLLGAHDYVASVVAPGLVDAVTVARQTTVAKLQLNTAPELSLIRDLNVTSHAAATPTDEDLALILNSVGAAGQLKWVGLTHNHLRHGAEDTLISQRLTPHDTTMIVLPLSGVNAQVTSVLATRLSGGRLVITPKFSVHRFWPQVHANHVTWISVTPALLDRLLLDPAARASYPGRTNLRFVRCSTSLAGDKLMQFEQRYQTRVLTGYGLAETANQGTLNPFAAPKIGSAGKPVGTDVAIWIDGHVTRASRVGGEIAVRGDHVIQRYLEPQPEAFYHGWLLTGDRGYFDEDGYLFINGPKKAMMNRGGEGIAPTHVNNALG
ncbi:AMP-binding protein [Levilactobacillus acidifarinae]|uniref:AMP-dependent synthetase and ligase n=1 Tax=Levilactobacillus acidifarinae DSM 19394 = JCM 15949 TaxID=1423715 RepID=A0A0R1LKG0_9LACO|nr:AMP-binding protein [Levilactobacillus acidifarinae]KRK96112.1 AMP-dependent synthetase and ligase [Levilactobacillus acidifarinae DSM 19394]GEO69615.1 acyl-CoA synthetase [Levilactobacillus acidifarinae]